MTDKQIIIDGVDVSGCEFLIIEKDKQLCRCIKADLFGGIEFVENARKGNCKDNSNCYYKNWKRKEQECEELKNFHINLVGVKECDIKELVKLKQTLTEIKEIVHKIDDECEIEGFGSCALKYKKQILNKISEVEDVR